MRKRVLYYTLATIFLLLIVELVFRTVVADKLMKYEDTFAARTSAFFFWVKNRNKPFERHIRLRENAPNSIAQDRPTKQVLGNSDNLKDTTYSVRTDSDGFILPTCCQSDKYMFFVGGSTTACIFVDEHKRFPYLVGRKLAEYGYVFNVKNSGVPGNNTMHSIDLLVNKILRYQPKIVVLMEAVNDLAFLTWNKSYYTPHKTRGLIIDEHTSQVETPDLIGEFKRTKNFIKVDTLTIFGEYKDALKMFVAICKVKKVLPVLMTQFNRIEKTDTNQIVRKSIDRAKEYADFDYVQYYKRMNDIVREVSYQENVPLIDLDSLVPKTRDYMYDAVHLNNTGSEYVSAIVSRSLVKIISSDHLAYEKK